jgi:hypothetical protein
VIQLSFKGGKRVSVPLFSPVKAKGDQCGTLCTLRVSECHERRGTRLVERIPPFFYLRKQNNRLMCAFGVPQHCVRLEGGGLQVTKRGLSPIRSSVLAGLSNMFRSYAVYEIFDV